MVKRTTSPGYGTRVRTNEGKKGGWDYGLGRRSGASRRRVHLGPRLDRNGKGNEG